MAGESNRFGDYRVDSLIGEGGMGKVFRARQISLDRWVALKVLPRARENKTFVERFYREARSAAKLVHPNIIQIYTVQDLDGIPFYAMEYVEGDDLEHMLRKTEAPYTHDETMETIRSVTKALALAAEHGIVHRDIKPANIMITKSGLVKVMDFGLAKGIDNSMTQAGLIVGTPSYMSPEQGAGKVVDGRSDIYSLGCVMYECLAGVAPFEADNVAALIYKHMYENPPAPKTVRPDIHPEMEKICLKMMAKNTADRFQTGRELLDALSQIPANSAAAESSLAKRAEASIQRRKESSTTLSNNAATMITPEGFLGVSPAKKGDSGMNLVPQHAGLPTVPEAPAIQSPPAPQRPKTPLSPLPAPVPARASFTSGIRPRLSFSSQPTTTLPTPPPVQAPAPTPAQSSAPTVSNAPAVDTPDAAVAAPPATPPPSMQTPPREPVSRISRRTTNVIKRDAQPAAPSASSSGIMAPSTVLFNIGATPASGRLVKPVDSAIFKIAPRMEMFARLPDGRWSYKIDQGHCTASEGLAAELPAIGKPVGLGDCLLCNNWNKRSGCAVAQCLEMERQKRFQGLKLVSEEALIWAGCGRFDRAVALLDNYIKNFPDDPEGYRELARLYDRPDYRGRDKRRMIVLYQRFTALAREKGTYSLMEISRAEERALALASSPVETKSGFHSPSEGIAFHCFYRTAFVCFAYGVLLPERLVVARAGDVDPDSGIAAADMGGAMGRATTIFRRFKSEHAKKDEQAVVKKELTRLSDLPLESLAGDAAKVLTLNYEQMHSVDLSIDSAVKIYTVSIKSVTGAHQLLFSESAAFKAEQCYELIRRQLAKQGKR